MKTIAFFNNKGGVGKTSLVYHLAWMYAELGVKTLAVDLDPQANLTSMFLDEARLEELWPDGEHPDTVYGAIRPILRGIGDIAEPHVEQITPRLGLIPGDLGLSRFEDKLSDAWPRCHNGDESAFRTMTAFHRLIKQAADETGSELVLIDVGPNLGAINRSALIASDYVCLPLAPDLFSLQGLKNLGPTLREWRSVWGDLLKKAPNDISMPKGSMQPLGYVVMQHSTLSSRPVKAYKRWMEMIPAVYRKDMLIEQMEHTVQVEQDRYCLSRLKHYRSLMPMAMAARKPIFFLRSADGAIGAHIEAVGSCYEDFYQLAEQIAAIAEIDLYKYGFTDKYRFLPLLQL